MRLLFVFVLIFSTSILVFSKPVVTITSPISSYNYTGGDLITLTGSATDATDGTLDGSTFEWYVIFHHNEHAHDGPAFRLSVKSTIYEISRSNEIDASIYYEFILIAKNSLNQSDTDRVIIYPFKSIVTITSNIEGIKFNQVTSTYTTPFTKQGVAGMDWVLFAAQEQVVDEDTLYFISWGQSVCTNTGLLLRIPKNDTLISLNYIKKSDAFNTITYSKTISGRTCVNTVVSTFSNKTCKIEKDTLFANCTITSDINVKEAFNQLIIYPNPTKDKVHILGIKNIKSVQLTHIITSHTYELQVFDLNDNPFIEIKSLPIGLYTLSISTLSHTYHNKLLINTF